MRGAVGLSYRDLVIPRANKVQFEESGDFVTWLTTNFPEFADVLVKAAEVLGTNNIELNDKQKFSYYIYIILATLQQNLNNSSNNDPTPILNIVEVTKKPTVSSTGSNNSITLNAVITGDDFQITVIDSYATYSDYVCSIYDNSSNELIATYTKETKTLTPNDFVTELSVYEDSVFIHLNTSYHELPFEFYIKSTTANYPTENYGSFIFENKIDSINGDDDELMTYEATKYTIDQKLKTKADINHTHSCSDITDLEERLSSLDLNPAHTHTCAEITDLQTQLDKKIEIPIHSANNVSLVDVVVDVANMIKQTPVGTLSMNIIQNAQSLDYDNMTCVSFHAGNARTFTIGSPKYFKGWVYIAHQAQGDSSSYQTVDWHKIPVCDSNGTLTASNIKSDNETRLAALESKINSGIVNSISTVRPPEIIYDGEPLLDYWYDYTNDKYIFKVNDLMDNIPTFTISL